MQRSWKKYFIYTSNHVHDISNAPAALHTLKTHKRAGQEENDVYIWTFSLFYPSMHGCASRTKVLIKCDN